MITLATFPLTVYGGPVMFAAWVWMIFLTFPGNFVIQPAVFPQTFGHKHGGTIYGLLYPSDIVNNLIIGWTSSPIKEHWGWPGIFLIMAAFALLGIIYTGLFTWKPSPQKIKRRAANANPIMSFKLS